MDEKGDELREPENKVEEPPSEPEKEIQPENLEQVLERQSEQAANEVAGLGQEGRSLEDVLTKREAEGGDIDDFKRGEEEIEDKAKKEEEEYNDSFRTPGDIESYIKSQNVEGSEGGVEEFKEGQEEIKGETENIEKTNIDGFITEENKDDIEYIKKGLESIEELNNADEKRKKLREMAGKILELSEGKSDAFKNRDMKELVVLMNSISDKIDSESKSESNAKTITTEKPQLEKTGIKNSIETNAEKTDREFIQSYYDDFSAKIKEIVKSNQSYSKKFDAIDKLSDELREQIDFIRRDILKTDAAKEILGNLKREFSKANEDIKESISEKDLREEASNDIQNSAKMVENSLKNIELSEETASGKISAIKGISSVFELTVKIYENIIDNDETLKSIVNGRREMLKTAMRKLEEEQKNYKGSGLKDTSEKKDVEPGDIDEFGKGEKEIEDEATKNKEEYESSFKTPGDIESDIRSQSGEGDEGGGGEENKGDLSGKE